MIDTTDPLQGRAPWVTAKPLNADAQRLVDRVKAEWTGQVGVRSIDSAGRLLGPFDLMAASPRVGLAVLDVAASFRHGLLDPAERELVILTVAQAERSDVMWAGHAWVATSTGVSPEMMEVLGHGGEPNTVEPLTTLMRAARRLVTAEDLDQEEFEAALAVLGWGRLQELIWLVGIYRALALAMRVARTPHPSGTRADYVHG